VPTDEARHDTHTGTLGSVLYARPGKRNVSESEWVTLVQSIATGNQLALNDLFQRSNRLVFTLVLRLTNDREKAEELTLDVFHDVWRGAAKYTAAGGTVLGWIMNQARSRAIDHLRFVHRLKRVNSHPHDAVPDATAISADEALRICDEANVLRGALTRLTLAEREAIETAFFLGLTHAEVAERLRQPLGTVKTRIRSGMAKLRHALAPSEGSA
jgi:RNA polymerase sigma-70 factor (ECF subfamily)